jgi:hypothetical protein
MDFQVEFWRILMITLPSAFLAVVLREFVRDRKCRAAGRLVGAAVFGLWVLFGWKTSSILSGEHTAVSEVYGRRTITTPAGNVISWEKREDARTTRPMLRAATGVGSGVDRTGFSVDFGTGEGGRSHSL